MSSPLEDKLKEIFDDNRKAVEVIKKHPGQNFEQIKKTFDKNVSAHVIASNHIGLFVYNVLNRKGDLTTLANSAAKRIVLSDPRIEAAFAKLKPEEKISRARKISETIVVELTSYFENLKGKKLDQAAISEELTTKVTTKVAEQLSSSQQAKA